MVSNRPGRVLVWGRWRVGVVCCSRGGRVGVGGVGECLVAVAVCVFGSVCVKGRWKGGVNLRLWWRTLVGKVGILHD